MKKLALLLCVLPLAACSSISGLISKSPEVSALMQLPAQLLNGAIFASGTQVMTLEVLSGPYQGCRVVAQGSGDMQTGRVMATTDTLNCKQDAQVTQKRIEGFVVGADGKTGIPAALKPLRANANSQVLEVEPGLQVTVVLLKPAN